MNARNNNDLNNNKKQLIHENKSGQIVIYQLTLITT